MDIFLLIVSLLIGWLCGWLVNYLADVLPATRSFSRPACPKCQTSYTWAGYLFLQKCAQCGAHRKPRVLVVQILMTIVSALIWLFPRPYLPYPLAMLLLTYFLMVAVIDLEYRVILNPVSLFGAALGLGTGIYLRSGASLLDGITSTLIGGAVGFAIMLVFYFIGEAYVRRMAKKKGLPADEVALGFGDVNLAGIIGLTVGWPSIIAGLFFAILGGGLVSLIIVVAMLLSKKYRAFTAIPYAPFLILSVIYLLFI
jgi:prepilin signal peptidase PulO-like enzyme (type II secretory pathway)